MEKSLLIRASTAKTNGGLHDISVDIPPSMISGEPGDTWKMSVTSFQMFNALNNINETNRYIRFEKVSDGYIRDVIIPVGTYKMCDLADMVTSLYAGVTCTYNKLTNAFEFSFQEQHNIYFYGKAWRFFGYAEGEVVTNVLFTASSTYANPYPVQSVCIDVGGLDLQSYSSMNNLTGEVLSTNTILSMPITEEPYHLVRYEPNVSTPFYVRGWVIDNIRLLARDIDGSPITFMTDYAITLRFELVSNALERKIDLLTSRVSNILEYVQFGFLQQNIK